MNSVSAIILAAGEGKRMKSSLPKVLHKVGSRPMLGRVMDAVNAAGISRLFVITGFGAPQVQEYVGERGVCVRQPELKGTADAVRQVQAEPALQEQDSQVLVICGDTPLLRSRTISRLLEQHRQSKAYCTLLTARIGNPTGYGRIVRDAGGQITSIVEERDATVFQRAIEEINVGLYVFKSRELFQAIEEIQPQNAQQEYYLTDVIGIFQRHGYPISCLSIDDPEEIMGINSRSGLAQAAAVLRNRALESFMDDGVTIIDPQTTYIDENVKIGRDTVIYPLTVIEGNVTIGSGCSIGPFCHVRAGSHIADGVSVGNFAEINRSTIGSGSRVKHQSYIGDAEIGERVNIGAGTIIANYDGKNKHKTKIGDAAFIGTGTILVAPVSVGRAAITGAGAVVPKNKNVADNTVVIGIPAKTMVKKSGS